LAGAACVHAMLANRLAGTVVVISGRAARFAINSRPLRVACRRDQ